MRSAMCVMFLGRRSQLPQLSSWDESNQRTKGSCDCSANSRVCSSIQGSTAGFHHTSIRSRSLQTSWAHFVDVALAALHHPLSQRLCHFSDLEQSMKVVKFYQCHGTIHHQNFEGCSVGAAGHGGFTDRGFGVVFMRSAMCVMFLGRRSQLPQLSSWDESNQRTKGSCDCSANSRVCSSIQGSTAGFHHTSIRSRSLQTSWAHFVDVALAALHHPLSQRLCHFSDLKQSTKVVEFCRDMTHCTHPYRW